MTTDAQETVEAVGRIITILQRQCTESSDAYMELVAWAVRVAETRLGLQDPDTSALAALLTFQQADAMEREKVALKALAETDRMMGLEEK